MSKTRNYLHIVFGTKYRKNVILLDRKERLYRYITGTVKNKNSEIIAINGVENHIHILLNLHPTVSLSEIVKSIKQSSSKRISETNYLPMFEGWANEYFACSVSPSHVEAVKNYIMNQEIHHHGRDYKEEVQDFVLKMGLTLYKDEI